MQMGCKSDQNQACSSYPIILYPKQTQLISNANDACGAIVPMQVALWFLRQCFIVAQLDVHRHTIYICLLYNVADSNKSLCYNSMLASPRAPIFPLKIPHSNIIHNYGYSSKQPQFYSPNSKCNSDQNERN